MFPLLKSTITYLLLNFTTHEVNIILIFQKNIHKQMIFFKEKGKENEEEGCIVI